MRSSSRLASIVLVALALSPAVAAAQAKGGKKPPAKPPAAAPAKPPPATPPPASPATADPEALAKKATAYFMKGSDLFKIKKYKEALEQFKLSYATVQSPNSHLYIARCLAAMGEARNAWLEFDQVVDEASARAQTEDKYAPTRDTAKVERDELNAKLALVTITVAGASLSTVVRVGAHEVPQNKWAKPYPLDPSTVEVVIENAGKPGPRQTVMLTAGSKRDLKLNVEFPKAPPPAVVAKTKSGPPLRPLAFVAGGVGVAGFIMFAVGGAVSSSTFGSLKTLCGGEQQCPPDKIAEAQDKASAGKTQQAVANAGLAIGIIGVAAGATLFALSFQKPKKDSVAAPTLHVGPQGAFVSGSF